MQLLNSITASEIGDYESKMRFLLKRVKDFLAKKEYGDIPEIIATYLNVYQKLIFAKEKEIKYSYLLELRDSVYFYLLEDRSNEDLKKVYVQIMYSAKDVITYSLYNCTKEVVHQEIKDFIYMKQILSTYYELNGLRQLHDKIFIDILCRLTNYLKVNGEGLSLVSDYVDQLELLSEIKILDTETDLYQESQINVEMHELKDTRNYYIALLLCFYYQRNKNKKYDEIFNKLKYIRSGEQYEIWKYQNVLNAFENISEQDFQKIFFIQEAEEAIVVQKVRSELEKKVKQIKDSQLKELEERNLTDLVEKEIESLKVKAIQDFKNYNPYDTKIESNYDFFKMKTNFCISKRSLVDSSIISYGTNYCSFIEPFLYRKLIRMNNCSIKNIKSVLEIADLRNDNTLILPNEYRDYFYTGNIPNIKYLDYNIIQIDDFIFKLNYFHVSNGLILKDSDFYSLISLKELRVLNKEEWKQQDEDFVMNVNVEFIFAFNKSKIFNAYRLEY